MILEAEKKKHFLMRNSDAGGQTHLLAYGFVHVNAPNSQMYTFK